MKKTLILLFILMLPLTSGAIERISLILPDYFQGTGAQVELVAGLSRKAVASLNLKFGEYIEAFYLNDNQENKPENKTNAEYTAELIPVFAGANSTLLAMVKSKAQSTIQPVPTNLTGEITLESAERLADGIFLQWAAYHNFLQDKLETAPLLVDEISTDALKQSISTEYAGNAELFPQGIAVKKNGNFIVGFSFADAEMDRYFKIISQPGKVLSDEKNNSYAYGVGITPGNTVYFKPAAGRDILRVVEGLPRAQKWKAGIDLYGPFTVMPDGSVVIINQTAKKAYKIYEKNITELNLFSSQYTMPAAITTDPEGNLWVLDTIERRISIYTPRGEFIKGITPVISPYDALVPFSFAVFKDGSFVLSSMNELLCFRKNGILLWRMKEIQGEVTDKLPTTFYFCVDPDFGLIYLTDPMGKRIIKLLDAAYCRQHNIQNSLEEKIIALNRQIRAGRGVNSISVKAGLYEEKGAFEMAAYLWACVLDVDPFNEEAGRHLDAMEVKILHANAAKLKAEAIDILNRVGPASAERVYKLALQQYETILSIDAGNTPAREELEDLKARYTKKTAAAGKNSALIEITGAKIKNLYPSLMHYYQKNPAGQVTVKNTLSKKITRVRAGTFIRRYMDGETESPLVEEINPGETKSINLYVVLNEEIFTLEEDLPKQAEITVTYLIDGNEQQVTKSTGFTIYRRTSLTWDDSGKLASFIMPNDEIISGFSHKVVDEGEATQKYKISKKFFRAIRICDALGLYGIKYIEDPDSPFSRVLGKDEVVDTVRFPRTTLLIHSGDCDDSTALLGSLLESAGIRTAVMTSPGHVFLAFDTEEPAENLWQFRTVQFEALTHNNTVWIPVETTLLKNGFKTAWEKASEIVRNNKSKTEFLPVTDLRAQYPPLPLPGSQFTVVEPEAAIINPFYNISVHGVVDNMYTKTLADLETKLKTAKGTEEAKILNQAGALHARFSQFGAAEKVLQQCMEKYPVFLASYTNLANLMIEDSRYDDAMKIITKGLSKKPESTTLNLLMARCYYNTGNKTAVEKYYTKVKAVSPSLAERYTYLLDINTGRAKAADEELPLLWITSE